jgi:hypothetical protein
VNISWYECKKTEKNEKIISSFADGQTGAFSQHGPALSTATEVVGKVTITLPTASRRQSPF